MVTMVTRGILILKTRILSYLRTKAEFSNHLRLMFDSSELKFRKIFNSNEFSPMRGDGNTRKIFLNFNSEESLLLLLFPLPMLPMLPML